MQVRWFRQHLIWPLQLMPRRGLEASLRPWRHLLDLPGCPWVEVVDEYTGDPDGFHERHYHEFVTFLPYVQRFLYGEGRGSTAAGGRGSPMRVFRRRDIAAVRLQPRPGDAPVTLQVVHIDLYFFEGADTVLLNVEVSADNLPLPLAQLRNQAAGREQPAPRQLRQYQAAGRQGEPRLAAAALRTLLPLLPAPAVCCWCLQRPLLLLPSGRRPVPLDGCLPAAACAGWGRAPGCHLPTGAPIHAAWGGTPPAGERWRSPQSPAGTAGPLSCRPGSLRQEQGGGRSVVWLRQHWPALATIKA